MRSVCRTAPALRQSSSYHHSSISRSATAAMSTVAVIGAGPAGLSMLKTLREDGFNVTLFERRSIVGGLWAYSPNKEYTSALKVTRALLSKYTCGFTDFPIPDKYPDYLLQRDFQEFLNDYASHFSLHKDIVFNATVQSVNRDPTDTKWQLNMSIDGQATETRDFDKVIFCHGYQTKPKMPQFPGQADYTGQILHSQQYRDPADFKGKKVVLLGISASTSDIAPYLAPHAEKVYISHREGNPVGMRYRTGTPADLLVTWRRRTINWWCARHIPSVHRAATDTATKYLATNMKGYKIDPSWRLYPFPSVTLRLPGPADDLIPGFAEGSLTSLHGIKSFLGGKTIEFSDGTVLEDIDAVIFTTGYSADFSVAPFVEKSRPSDPSYGGSDMMRLYMNIFPPKYADSCAMICHSAFGKNNGFSFSDVMAMAISNVWRSQPSASSPLPPLAERERWVDDHQSWVARKWKLEHKVDVSMVKPFEFQPWLHEMAGTGMENLGWGWAGWKFWWRDREMYRLMAHGPETAHMFRYFETGKRKTWPGAKEEIRRINKTVRERFPLKDQEAELRVLKQEQHEISLSLMKAAEAT